jgi:predicted DNA-binding transcriptional regulator AlpA
MKQLATTAARPERVYTDKQGKTRIIKARPASQGILPIGETTLREWIKAGRFPAPVKIGDSVTAWSIDAIEAWLEQHTRPAVNAQGGVSA